MACYNPKISPEEELLRRIFGEQISKLDLSHVPNLTFLSCKNSGITELDISSLASLEHFFYDKSSTRLIQRPDQNF